MSYLLVFLLLSFFILVHEFGHFFAARFLGIPIARFSVGLGPRLWSVTRGETEYRLSMIPIGGYVLPDLSTESKFFSLSIRKRILFALGGPAANIVAAGLLFAVLEMLSGPLTVSGVLGDAFVRTVDALVSVAMIIPAAFDSPQELNGVVGIVADGGDFVGTNLVRATQLAIVLNLNLAVLNLIPLPPLDGCKIFFYLLESLGLGLERLHIPFAAAGWVLILGVIGYATLQDIKRLIFSALT